MKNISALICIPLLLSLMSFFPVHAFSQTWQWARESICSSYASEGYYACGDPWGNVFDAGICEDSVIQFGTTTLKYRSMVYAKYDNNGNCLWADGVKNGIVYPLGIATDELGALYVLGYYSNSPITIGNSILYSNNTYGLFLAKYSSSGSLEWAKNIEDTPYPISAAIATFGTKLYLSLAYSTPTFTIGSFTVHNADISGNTDDLLLAKLDMKGNVLWARSDGGTGDEIPNSITVSPKGSIYLCGNYATLFPFGTDTLIHTSLYISGVFLARYDSAGIPVWAMQAKDSVWPTGIAADRNDNVFMSGIMYDSVSFGSYTLLSSNPSESNVFIVKLDSNKTPLWGRAITGPSVGNYNIASDPCGNIWVAGGMTSDFTIDNNTFYPPVINDDPMYLVGLNGGSGSLIFGSTVGTGGDDWTGVGTDGLGNVYVTADRFVDPITIGNSVLYNPHYGEDIFVAKVGSQKTDTLTQQDNMCFVNGRILKAPAGFLYYKWNDSTVGATHAISNAGKYWVYCSGNCSNSIVIDTFSVTYQAVSITYKDTILCLVTDTFMLQAPKGYFSYTWSTGDTGISITAYAGNKYWVYSDSDCNASADTFDLRKNSALFSLGKDTSGCGPIVFQAPQYGDTYMWQDGSTGSTYTAYTSGVYYLNISIQGCAYTDTVSAYISDVTLQLRDTSFCADKSISFMASVNLPQRGHILWSDGSNQSDLLIRDTGIYWLTIKDSTCSLSDTFKVSTEICDCYAFIPNAFTPNGDGKNDFSHPLFEQNCMITDYSFAIYNRWGQKVFFSYDPSQSWNGVFSGVLQEIGTYFYTLEYKGGTKHEKHFMKGDVTLVR